MLYILLDAGHGSNTPGKRSPRLPNGKQFFEWEFCREVVNLLYIRLTPYYIGATSYYNISHLLKTEFFNLTLNPIL